MQRRNEAYSNSPASAPKSGTESTLKSMCVVNGLHGMAEPSLRPDRGVGYSPADLLHRALPPLLFPGGTFLCRGGARRGASRPFDLLMLTEVLVHPYRHGNQALAREYSEIFLHAWNVSTVSRVGGDRGGGVTPSPRRTASARPTPSNWRQRREVMRERS